MSQKATLIYDLKNLKLNYNNRTVLQIGNLQIHRGTIYGIIGPVGSGKSSLLKTLAGQLKPDSGSLKYDSHEFSTNWMGKIKPEPSIKLANIEELTGKQNLSNYLSKKYSSRKDKIIKRHFNGGSYKHFLTEPISDRSPGELALINTLIALESDPRVLLMDDYGIHFDNSMQQEFNRKIIKMSRELGTTILLTSGNADNIQNIASVLIFLDNGHICKIRPGKGRNTRHQHRRRN